MKAKGCPFYCKTTPILVPEASVYTWNGTVKSGNARTGADDRANFNVWNAELCTEVQMNNESFLSRSVSGQAMMSKWRTNFL